MIDWLKSLLGFSSAPTTDLYIDARAQKGRVLLTDIEEGKVLLNMLESDPELTELSLATFIGRNVSYVHRVVHAARTARTE